MTSRVTQVLCLFVLLLTGCASHPDLKRLYENIADDPHQPPVIVLHGLAGSTLIDAKTGKEFWPGGLSALAFSNYRGLAQMSSENREGEGLVPGDLTYGVGGVDFYADLLHALESVGRFERGTPGTPVGNQRRRYYVFVYDWRKDDLIAVRKLHALIEQIRLDYGDPTLKVDLIAHSNGGLIADYYLRYGPNDVLSGTGPFKPWDEGDKRIRRLVLLGMPELGAVTSLERLIHGMRVGFGTVPAEVMATFVTPYQTLPHPLTKPLLDIRGATVDLDIYDPAVWRREHWGVYAPEVMARVRDAMSEPTEGEQAVSSLQATFDANLRRAERWQWAITAPLPPNHVEIAAFGGDCEATPSHAVMLQDAAGPSRLVFRASQVTAGHDNANHGRGIKPLLDYDQLMSEPGDGLVTRSSQAAKRPFDLPPGDDRFHPLPVDQTFFLCESHGRLTHNLYFQNNLLYFLLSH